MNLYEEKILFLNNIGMYSITLIVVENKLGKTSSIAFHLVLILLRNVVIKERTI